MAFDISKIQASSLTPGITIVGRTYPFSRTFSGTIPINGSLSTSLNLTLPSTEMMTNIRVNFVGGNIGSLWFPVMGRALIRENGYTIAISVTSTGSGRALNVYFINRTVAATVTLPNLTINARVRPYKFPF